MNIPLNPNKSHDIAMNIPSSPVKLLLFMAKPLFPRFNFDKSAQGGAPRYKFVYNPIN